MGGGKADRSVTNEFAAIAYDFLMDTFAVDAAAGPAPSSILICPHPSPLPAQAATSGSNADCTIQKVLHGFDTKRLCSHFI